jgi:hypothetical protein
VRNVYRALEKPIPEELFVTNITTEPPRAHVSRPSGFIQPVIDGRMTSYFEWIGSGCVETGSGQVSMHQVSEREPGLTLIEFGFDLEHLYVRCDASQPMQQVLARGIALSLNFIKPGGTRVTVHAEGTGVVVRLVARTAEGLWEPADAAGLSGAVHEIAELKIPFARLMLGPGAPVAFMVALNRGASELEHHPRHRPIEFTVPASEFAAVNWTA